MTKHLKRSYLATLVGACLACVLIGSQANATDTLHVIIVADTNDARIGETVGVDLATVAAFFSEPTNVPPGTSVQITKIQGDQFTQKTVMETINDLPGGPENRYLWYYVGHGAYDLKRGHHFSIPGDGVPGGGVPGGGGERFLSRQRVLAALVARQPKLTLLISDCCSDIHVIGTKKARPVPRDCAKIVRDLFFDALDRDSQSDRFRAVVDNVVNINSCTERQVAAGADGGYFTNTLFYDVLPQGTKLEQQRELSRRDDFVTWREVLPVLVPATETAFQAGSPRGEVNRVEGERQLVQTPQAFQLPADARDPQPPWWFGVGIEKRFPGPGARVGATKPGSVAAVWLKRGDLIRMVNGVTVRHWMDFDYLIDASDGSVAMVWEREGTRIEQTITLPFYEDRNQPKDSVEIEINAPGPEDDYITWAPTFGRVRLRRASSRTGDATIFLTNDQLAEQVRAQTKGLSASRRSGNTTRADAVRTDGDVWFADANGWSQTGTAREESLEVKLPGNGDWVPFVVAGKFGRPSSRDRDAVIEARQDTIDGPVIATHFLMVRVRKAAHTLSADERERFLSALFHLKRNQTYKRFEDVHADANQRGHTGPVFLPWHRAFLLDLERELQAIDPSVTLPYADWSAGSETLATILSRDFMGRPGSQLAVEFDGLNPIATWRHEQGPLIRGIRIATLGRLPASFNPPRYLNMPVYDAGGIRFWDELEGQHGGLHGWIGGSGGWMSSLGTAAQDPLFYLHHSYVDRMWATWQHRHGRFGKTQADYDNGVVPDGNTSETIVRYHSLDSQLWPWDDGTFDRIAPAQNNVWPSSAAVPQPADMIDYLGLNDHRVDLGFCYDDLHPSVQPRVSGTRSLPASAADVARTRSLATDPEARAEQRIIAINELPSSTAIDDLIQILREDESATRATRALDGPDLKTMTATKLRGLAFSSVGQEGRSKIDAVFREFILDERDELRNLALAHLMARRDGLAVAAVKRELNNGPADKPVISKVEAIGLLSLASPIDHIQSIRPALADTDPQVRVAAIRAIGSLLDFQSDQNPVIGMLQNSNEDIRVRIAALQATEVDAGLAARHAIALISDASQPDELRQAAIHTLAAIVSSQVRSIIQLPQADNSRDTRLKIAEVLRAVTGSPTLVREANNVVTWLEDHDPAFR